MPAVNAFDCFSEDLATGVHDFSTHVIKMALSNTAPDPAAHTVLADITQIAAGGGYVAGGYTLDGVTVTRTGEDTVITATDEVIAAVGAAIATHQYLVFYNDTGVGDPLIGYIDRGSAIDIADGNQNTVDLSTNGFASVGPGTIT